LDNGVDGTKLFTDEMKKEFEKADFSGVKMEGLFKQFEELFKEEAEKGADIYKEHFISYVNGYINQNLYKQKVDSGEMKPNSKWDADLYNGKVNYGLNES
ncbi:MAG: hypothetical protein K2G83_01625, partial [Ruminococcus sp.]|nr:hypothetical protein [Ruminococcus sp.]